MSSLPIWTRTLPTDAAAGWRSRPFPALGFCGDVAAGERDGTMHRKP
jgi:hypothetical protein